MTEKAPIHINSNPHILGKIRQFGAFYYVAHTPHIEIFILESTFIKLT